MSRPIFAIRPEPGLSATVRRYRHAGLELIAEALFTVVQVEWQAGDPDEFDALIIGSANAIRHGGPQLERYRDKPVHAVGKSTANAAMKAGFSVKSMGNGGLQAVLDTLAGQSLRLLRLAGAERTVLSVPRGISVHEQAVYALAPVPISALLEKRLRCGGIVLLHSAAAARHFAAECSRLEIPRSQLAVAALGQRISNAAGAGWQAVRHCSQPSDAALLALAGNMCQER